MTSTPAAASHRQQQIKMLIVEDDAEFVEATREYLSTAGRTSFDVESVSTLADAIRRTKRRDIDIVLLDLGLPDSDRLQTFERLLPHVSRLPVIIISGHDDEELAVRAVQAGAQEYLVKGQITSQLLVRVARHAIERKRLEESLREREAFFRLITENAQDLIAVLDRKGKRLYTSPAYRDLLDDSDSGSGANSFDSIHPDDLSCVKKLFDATVATGVGGRAEYRFVTKGGEIRFIESVAARSRTGLGGPRRLLSSHGMSPGTSGRSRSCGKASNVISTCSGRSQITFIPSSLDATAIPRPPTTVLPA